MKLYVVTTLGLGLLITPLYAQESQSLSQDQQLSYSLGYNIGQSLEQRDIEIKIDSLVKGLKDALSDNQPLLGEAEMGKILQAFQKELIAKKMAAINETAKMNREKGKAFLEENAKKEGVVTLESGLQYKVIRPGTGKMPTATDKVTTHYHGTLIDGTVFDSSVARNEPASFPVNGVIKGWQEALQLMKEGAKWQLFIPAKLAYGKRGTPNGKIGPNETLIFDIELLSIQ